jgi:hypothetical protein
MSENQESQEDQDKKDMLNLSEGMDQLGIAFFNLEMEKRHAGFRIHPRTCVEIEKLFLYLQSQVYRLINACFDKATPKEFSDIRAGIEIIFDKEMRMLFDFCGNLYKEQANKKEAMN